MARFNIVGADGIYAADVNPNGALEVDIEEASVIIPIDVQSHLQTTIQTHNAVSIALSSNSPSAWFDTDGFDKIALTLLNDAGTTNSGDILWSNDGATQQGIDLVVLPSNTNQYKTAIIDTRARYFKLRLNNGDAALAHTMSAWAYLKA